MKIIHSTFDAMKSFDKNLFLQNKSGSIELEATSDEIEDFERRSGLDVEDVVPDWLMGELLVHFRHEGALSDDYEFVCK